MSNLLPKLEEMPHNKEAEQSLLGALLIDPDAIFLVRDEIQPEAFYLVHHGNIYQAYCEMLDAGREINIVSLTDTLDQAGKLEEIGGAAYLTHLINTCPTSLNIRSYATIVKRDFRLRRAINGAREIVRDAFQQGADPDQIEGKVLQLSTNLAAETLSTVKDARTLVNETMDEISHRFKHPELYAAWKSPWKSLTESPIKGSFRGLRPKDFVIVAGRPGMGKSAFVLQWAHHLAEQGAPGAIFSLEMTNYSILCREAARRMGNGLTSAELMDAEFEESQMPALIQAMGEIGNLPLFYDDTAGLTIEKLSTRLRHLVLAKGIRWAIVDYLQLLLSEIASGRETREREVARISRMGKVLAKDLDICLVATAQLNRGVEYRSDKRPGLADLRESGQVEQDADIIMFIYRDDYYNVDSDQPHIAEINIAKHRNGRVMMVPLYWQGETTSFHSIELITPTPAQSLPDWD